MKVYSKSSLFEAIVANEDRLQALGVGRIGVFGSFVRNEQRDDSDEILKRGHRSQHRDYR